MVHIIPHSRHLKIELLSLLYKEEIILKKQIFLKESNAKLLRISPYVEIYGNKSNKILLYRRDTNQRLLIESNNMIKLNNLIEILEDGVEEEILIDILLNMGVEDYSRWIYRCVEKGMIE